MFSFQPTGTGSSFFTQPTQQQQQQQPQPQLMSTLPSISATTQQPYPRETPYDTLPIEIRNALSSLEHLVNTHTHSARRLAALCQDSDRSEQISRVEGEVAVGVEKIGRVQVRQEGAKAVIVDCRKTTGQIWRYSESVATSIGYTGQPVQPQQSATIQQQQQQSSPPQKYANLQLPPLDLSLFEKLVDRLDSQLLEAEHVATSLRNELQQRTTPTPSTATPRYVASAIATQQVLVRELRERVARMAAEAHEDGKEYRRFLIKFKSDSVDPFAFGSGSRK
jgi:hypothetical protein